MSVCVCVCATCVYVCRVCVCVPRVCMCAVRVCMCAAFVCKSKTRNKTHNIPDKNRSVMKFGKSTFCIKYEVLASRDECR